MDSKHQENHLKRFDEKSLEKLQSRIVFNDPSILYVFKKTEKVTAALYLVTNLISDNEPLKWQIRKDALGLVSDILTLKKPTVSQINQVFGGLVTTISELIALLKIAHLAEQISLMNYTILQKELTLIMGSLESINSEAISGNAVLLPQDFFDTPSLPNYAPAVSKGQFRTPNVLKDSGVQPQQTAQKDTVKDSRHDKIISLLKAGKPLGIKDFSNEIKDCSEKTIQRELLAMVETGVLKKTGERRWSLYSLA